MEPPAGYIKFTNKDRIELSDYVHTLCCGRIDTKLRWVGLSIGELRDDCDCNVDYVFKKCPVKPRFEPKFPYPHGY